MTIHIPVLGAPIIQALANCPSGTVIDCTLGGGGHTAMLLECFAHRSDIQLIAADQDQSAVDAARIRFASGRIKIIHARFSELEGPISGLLADLGWSSDQMEDTSRGLSFQREAPLDMRLDQRRDLTARDLLCRDEKWLTDIFSRFGGERYSRTIARAITRNHEQLITTKDLAELIWRSVPPSARYGRIHPATRVFQALRIVVNEEMSELESLLKLTHRLVPQGLAAIMSFHSLEDRAVKECFRQKDLFRPLTKKPIIATDEEQVRNPRSRSAKLRIAQRI